MSAAEYALRLANGEPLEVVLDEVWELGRSAEENESPFTVEAGAE